MATNLQLDDDLLTQARNLGQHRTKREAANAALRLYVQRLARTEMIASFGTIDFDPEWDYKAERGPRS